MRFAPAPLSAAILLLAGVSNATAAHELTNGRIDVIQADGSGGLNSTTQDRVDWISWVNSDGVSTGNLVSAGGPINCGDPQEFFGMSYGEPDGNGLYMIVNGTKAKWSEAVSGLAGTSKTTGKNACAQLSGTTITKYKLQNTAAIVNALRISRTFTFNNHALSENYNLRAYVSRVSYSKFTTVLVPAADGSIQTFGSTACGTACEISDWNGKWFANDDGAGNGVAIIRDLSSTWPAAVALDYDGYSAATLTSILLKVPISGWTGTVTETEWMCFYDSKSWTSKQRKAGKLPQGCKVSTP